MARYIAELSPQLQDDLARGRTINAARVYHHLFEKAVERDNDKKPLLKPRDRARLWKSWPKSFGSRAYLLCRSMRSKTGSTAIARRLPVYAWSPPAGPRRAGLLQTELRNANLLVRAHDREFAFVHTSFQEYFLRGS